MTKKAEAWILLPHRGHTVHYAAIQEQPGALKHSGFQNVSSLLINFKKERDMIFLAMESTDKHLLEQNVIIQGRILRSSRLSLT